DAFASRISDFVFFFQAEDGIRDFHVTGVQTVALPISGGDAGIAALATTQAASIESQLRFSRSIEQEADRIGMQTLNRYGMNPGRSEERRVGKECRARGSRAAAKQKRAGGGGHDCDAGA